MARAKEGDPDWREITGKIYWGHLFACLLWTVIQSSVGMGGMPSSTPRAIASL